MRTLEIRSALLIVLSAAMTSAAAATTPSAPAGRYCGELFTGKMVHAETEFSLRDGALLDGSYVFRDGDKMEDGSLSEKETPRDRTRTLIWTDKYGSGRLVITFSSDYESFTGVWGMNTQRPTYRWTGARCTELHMSASSLRHGGAA